MREREGERIYNFNVSQLIILGTVIPFQKFPYVKELKLTRSQCLGSILYMQCNLKDILWVSVMIVSLYGFSINCLLS